MNEVETQHRGVRKGHATQNRKILRPRLFPDPKYKMFMCFFGFIILENLKINMTKVFNDLGHNSKLSAHRQYIMDVQPNIGAHVSQNDF